MTAIEITELMVKYRKALQWRCDVASGEMIEAPGYTKTHMGFNSISQKHLDVICDAANFFFGVGKSDLRIGNSMGELIPGFDKPQP